MYLEKLEINGFKSFAKKVELEFKPSITAIVGPNGSGKSNIADAVRWVLGEQSLKLLRGKKSEDVIFSGSDKKSRLGMAEVSLYFNNSEDKANVEMGEICITRKLYRNGESEYLINKQKTRLADIHLLLAKIGVARASYSIIGQGMIDNFLLASPQERKDFFEEASGVKPLQIKRSQALNKLETTEENLETAQIQLQEIIPRLNSLTRQVKRLERRAEIELKLKDLQFKYYGTMWHEINKEWQEKHKNLKKIIQEQEKTRTEVSKFQHQLADLTKSNTKSDLTQKLQNEYQTTINLKMKLSQELSDLKIKIIQETQKVVKEKNIPYETGQKMLNALKELKTLKIKINNAFKDKNYSAAEKYFKKQTEFLEKLDIILAPYKNENEVGAKKENHHLQENIEKLNQQINGLNIKIKDIQEKIKKENEKEKQERSQIWQIQQKYQTKQQRLNQISNEVNNLRVEIARLETKKDDLENNIRQNLGNNGLLELSQSTAGVSQKMNGEQKNAVFTEISKLKHQLELIGGIDPEVQQEYEETKTRYDFLNNQIEDLKKSIDLLEKLILNLDENIKKQFEASFKIIDNEFHKYFKILFNGGKAKLILVKQPTVNFAATEQTTGHASENLSNKNNFDDQNSALQPETNKIKNRLKSNLYAGVEIEATPPGKKLKSINMLSGGERALTSIALLCAILSSNPSPFVILDEVDAALDEANSIRYAEIIEQLSHKSQFITITHNRATMEKANTLYGVTMGDDGASVLLSLKLETAKKFTNR